MTQQPVAFSGEFEVEDDAFECIVDRFIYRASEVSFQFSCRDSVGGKHTAIGMAERASSGRFVTSEFRVRYASDRTDTPATFSIDSIDYDAKEPSLAVSAPWAQAGDTFSLEARLHAFKI